MFKIEMKVIKNKKLYSFFSRKRPKLKGQFQSSVFSLLVVCPFPKTNNKYTRTHLRA